MKFSSLFRAEMGRLFRNRLTWLVFVLTALAPLAGYSFFHPTFGDSMSAMYLANPLLTGGLAGTLLFALLTLSGLESPARGGAAALTDSIVSPLAARAVRLLAVLAAAFLTALAIGLLYLPYTIWKLDIVFSGRDYWLAVGLFLLSGPLMGALAAAVAGQLTGRIDVSLLAVLAALIFSRGQWSSQYFLAQWSVPLVSTLSDAFGSAIVWRTAIYSRLVWLCFFGGGWLLSLLCVRQYGKGLAGSFIQHSRRLSRPITALALLGLGAWLWQAQPFVDHSPANWAEIEEPDRYNEALTVEKTELKVKIESYLLGTLSGTAAYQLRNSSGQPQELYLDLNPGYTLRSLSANGEALSFEDLKNDNICAREIRCLLPAAEEITLVAVYGGMPRIWNAQESLLSGSCVSGQGLSLSSMHLAPTVGGCALISGPETPVTMRITLPESLTPVSSGSTVKLKDNGDGTSDWLMEDVGTDRMRLFAGDYLSAELAAGSGMPIQFYYSQKYQSRLENGALKLMEQAVAYCARHYGPRSFTEDRPFKIVQLTAFEFGGFANANLSGMGESYFSDENLNDPDKGAASAEVLAHEIIHQWWGLGASLRDPEDEDWNDEGITVYTTYRLIREIMGEAYARENYVDKWQATMADQASSFYLRHPEYLDRLPERYANDIRSSLNAANWYDGNALLIYRAAQKLGEDKVDDIWSSLYMNGGSEMPPHITLGDFLNACGLSKGEVSRG